MNGTGLAELLSRLTGKRSAAAADEFLALPIDGPGAHMIGLSPAGYPALLLDTMNDGRPKDIILSGLCVSFDVLCRVSSGSAGSAERRVTIIECNSADEVRPLFAETAAVFLGLLGPKPTMRATAEAVIRMAAIFSSLTRPSRQSVTGLIGELMLILSASDPVSAIDCWRVHPGDRFDFSAPDARVEAKATSSGLRLHSFSWEQCNPPDGSALVASMFVEPSGGGVSVRQLLERIEGRLRSSPTTAVRLRETVSATMGTSLKAALDVRFDEQMCRVSLRWFDLRTVPAIRGELPEGVGGVRFTSDLSQVAPASTSVLDRTGLEHFLISPTRKLFLRRGVV